VESDIASQIHKHDEQAEKGGLMEFLADLLKD